MKPACDLVFKSNRVVRGIYHDKFVFKPAFIPGWC